MNTSSRDNANDLPLIVTAAVIRDGDKVLLAQRKNGSHLAGKWEFPGGKLEPGESPEACLVREIKEELNLEVRVGDIFAVVYHQYGTGPILLLAYTCTRANECRPLEGTAVQWVFPEDLSSLGLAPADVPIAQRLMRTLGGKAGEG